ncbi:MAG TPA: urea ABC transporter permease subunit UrtB [Burkholderiales bacterium]|nr:urea ABC transporter permease subunit UrtB [Burkholderiales bacterium]
MALDAQTVARLGAGDIGTKIEAVNALAASGDEAALDLLQALQSGDASVTPAGRVVVARGDQVLDAATMAPIVPAPEQAEPVVVNNRLRGALDAAIGALRLLSPDRDTRLASARAVESTTQAALLPLIEKALARETDPAIRASLEQTRASLNLGNPDPALRLDAVRRLGQSNEAKFKAILEAMLEKDAGGAFREPDEGVRAAAQESVGAIQKRLVVSDYAGRLFTGISLGSILLLVALGLAITYGLLGVINMAHGEMLMIGAYATYITQQAFKACLPGLFDWYLVAAIPVAFVAAALVGMALERTVIRWLYGRPLETLLATWGISLFLIQLVRQVFGAQNVEVSNPSWMSGGIALPNLVLPYNRIVIIGFSMLVLLLMWVILNRTRLGLFVRGVTQNRTMASCVGVPTGRIDLMAFGLGSGIAGLAGVALSQIGNVGPDLGQGYIIDSFMVVVTGGVGQLAGTVYAALGLGVLSKFLEPHIGAVLTKILVLVLIIAFIQKRPQGLFALKGRAVEA